MDMLLNMCLIILVICATVLVIVGTAFVVGLVGAIAKEFRK